MLQRQRPNQGGLAQLGANNIVSIIWVNVLHEPLLQVLRISAHLPPLSGNSLLWSCELFRHGDPILHFAFRLKGLFHARWRAAPRKGKTKIKEKGKAQLSIRSMHDSQKLARVRISPGC